MSQKIVNKLVLFQPCFAQYRKGFFRELSHRLGGHLEIYAAQGLGNVFKMPTKPAGFVIRQIKSISVKLGSRRVILQPYMLFCLLRKDVDVIVTMNQCSRIEMWVGLAFKALLGKKVILWGHGFTPRDGRAAQILRRTAMNRADGCILYTQGGKARAEQQGVNPEKLFVAPNALDTKSIGRAIESVKPQALERFRKENRLESECVLLFIGKLVHYKKPSLVIRALQYVLVSIPDAVAVFVGEGEQRNSLEELVGSLDIKDHVRFTGPIFNEQRLAPYFLSATAGIMPAHAGLFIQHAFQYGLPVVIGDDMSSHPPEIELVEDGLTGMFFRDGDAKDAAAKVCKIAHDMSLARRLQNEERKIVKTQYSIDKMTAGFMRAVDYARRHKNA